MSALSSLHSNLSSEFPPKGRDAVDSPNSFFPEEMDPQATRSLFVGNIPKNISVYELRDIFSRFGNILVGNGCVCVISVMCTALTNAIEIELC